MSEKIAPAKKYKTVFFDLDHTLWDYETNSRETLKELYEEYNLLSRGVHAIEDFCTTFRSVNEQLWVQYDRGQIDSDVIRRERFKMILTPFNAFEEKLCADISHDYLQRCPRKGALMPHALDVVTYLRKSYNLVIVTNGFEEIQHLKMSAGNLNSMFDHVVTSQKAGCKKPSRGIFDYALQLHGTASYEAIMIGDNLVTDIGGARNASIDAVYFNPERVAHAERPDREIHSLHELYDLL